MPAQMKRTNAVRHGATALALATALSFPIAALAMGSSSPSGSFGTMSSDMGPQKPTETHAYKKAVKLINQGKYDDAIKNLKSLDKSTPNDPDVLNYLGFAHRKLGKTAEALDYYQRALQADPNHLGANEYLGELYIQMGDMAKAEAQRAKLESLCKFGCTELEALKAAIADKGKAS